MPVSAKRPQKTARAEERTTAFAPRPFPVRTKKPKGEPAGEGSPDLFDSYLKQRRRDVAMERRQASEEPGAPDGSTIRGGSGPTVQRVFYNPVVNGYWLGLVDKFKDDRVSIRVQAEALDALVEERVPVTSYKDAKAKIEDGDFDDLLKGLTDEELEKLCEKLELGLEDEELEELYAEVRPIDTKLEFDEGPEVEVLEEPKGRLTGIPQEPEEVLKNLAVRQHAVLLADLTSVFKGQLGATGTKFGSRKANKFREGFKKIARQELTRLIEEKIKGELKNKERSSDSEALTRDVIEVLYKDAKAAVDAQLTELSNELAKKILEGLNTEEKLIKAGQGKGLLPFRGLLKGQAIDAIEKAAKELFPKAKTEALKKAGEVLKDTKLLAKQTTGVKERVKKISQKRIQQVIEAKTPRTALEKMGGVFDTVIPKPGDAASIGVLLNIPIPPFNYIFINLSGDAIRGVPGGLVAGYAKAADPRTSKHLDVAATFSFGGGVKIVGLDASVGLDLFCRAGAKDTPATMKALHYTLYRAASAVNNRLGTWLVSGEVKDSPGEDKALLAEQWAARIEKGVFGQDENAYGDIGLGGSASVGGSVGPVDLEAGVSFAGLKRYNQEALKKALGEKFGVEPESGESAKKRRSDVGGQTVWEFGASGSVEVGVLDHFLGLSGSFSFELSKKISDNWGAEIDVSVGFPFKKSVAETIALAALDGGDKLVTKIQDKLAKQDIGKKTKKKEVAGETAETADKGWKLARGVAEEKLSEQLGRVGGSQSLTVALMFGMDGGKFQYRIELRDVVTASKTLGLGSPTKTRRGRKRLGPTGLSGGYEKSSRRLMISGET